MQDDAPQQGPPDNPGWLATLQQDSWQAEILISGGGLVGVVALLDSTDDVHNALWHGTSLVPDVAIIAAFPLFLFTFILAQAFILHLILRGYWMGLVGLNLVFPQGIKQEKLNFQGKFKSFIKSNSNTPYLIKLDGLCSLIFAFTFFFIFSIAGLILFVLFMFGVAAVINEVTGVSVKLPRRVIGGVLAFCGLLTLVDFLTFGYLKRISWISRFYYPVHYVMSRVTLSFLYRRLYYSIISNIRPVYVILGLAAEFVILVLVLSIANQAPEDIAPLNSGADHFLELNEEVITGNSLRFSFSHFPWLEGELFSEWAKSHDGTVAKSFEDIPNKDKTELLESLYIITIDSVRVDSLTWMATHGEALGFTTMRLSYLVDVSHLERGRHELGMRMRLKQSQYTNQDSLKYFAKAYFLVDK